MPELTLMQSPLARNTMRMDGRPFKILLLLVVCANAGAITVVGVGARTDNRLGAQPAATFKVATWNLRGGSGVRGWKKTPPPFDSDTGNCTDPQQPLNAWGVGFTQRFLTRHIADDPDVVAFGAQEAWGCTDPINVAPVLTGWRSYYHGRAGVGLFARHGIRGSWDEFQIEKRGVGGVSENRFLIGANVCLDADCSHTAYIYSTHLGPPADAEWPAHVQKVLAFLNTRPTPQILVGDLNLWKSDRWSPRVNCGQPTPPMGTAYDMIAGSGFVDTWAVTRRGPGWSGMTSRRASSGWPPYCGEYSTGTPYKRIDYVWTKEVKPVGAELFGFTGPGQAHPSDHLGLKATIELPASPTYLTNQPTESGEPNLNTN
jgi:endonuclease/exonuclease/phosphatase family metal-dependent hydrolase